MRDSTSHFISFENHGSPSWSQETSKSVFSRVHTLQLQKNKGFFSIALSLTMTLRQSKAKEIGILRPCINIEGQVKHPWLKNRVVYLVRPIWSGVLWIATSGWNHHSISLRTQLMRLSRALKESRSKYSDFASWRRSATCCSSSENLPGNTPIDDLAERKLE